jgi:DNA-binding NarL/FixJ family response regulator
VSSRPKLREVPLEKFTVLVADDHAPTRADIAATLADDGRFVVCAAVGDAPAAVAAAVEHRPDLCVLDINMPGGGVAAAWEITSRLVDAKVVMLTVSRDDGDLFAALRAGAAGYLLKDIDPDRLGDALADVMAGEAAIPRSLVTRVLTEFRDRSPRRRALLGTSDESSLTSREWQVLELLRQDLQTSEIARRLFISQATVRSHVAAILRKLRVTDREALLRL